MHKQDDVEYEIPSPHSKDRMRPISHSATEGRANQAGRQALDDAKGIPYLYLSTDKETAMAEVRPSVGNYISVGQFGKTLKPLSLIDCSD